MNDFASDLFNFMTSLNRAYAKFDSMTPNDTPITDCISCDGKGSIGCTSDCFEPDLPTTCPKCSGGWWCPHMADTRAQYDKWQENERFCIKHHTCKRCHGTKVDPIQ